MPLAVTIFGLFPNTPNRKMFLPSKPQILNKVVATSLFVTLLALQNVTGGLVQPKRRPVPPYLRDADFENTNLMRLRRTSTTNLTSAVTETPTWDLAEDYIRPERLAYKGNKWINGIVPYTIDPKFTPIERKLITKGFEEYAKKTCIRFVPKTSKHRDYVDIQLDDEVCGLANVCRIGGKQFAKIGRKKKCVDINTILHELGHTICLSHEHKRHDRDDFIDLTKNSDKNNRNNQLANSDYTTLGLLYDYESVMHYNCPHFFKAKSAAVKSCGQGEKLSVLDAEKINSLYDCGGCHSYRFRQPQEARKDVANMGSDIDGKTLGVCRGYVNADIIPGKFRLGSAECHIPYKLKEHKLIKNFEVLTLPKPQMFSWVTLKNGKIPTNAVPGGRENGGIPLYIGRCFTKFNGKNTRVPGKIQQGKMYLSFGGKEYTCPKFEVLVCNAKS